MPRENDNDSNKEKRRGGEQNDPYPSPKKRMLSIRGVPNLAMVEGWEMIAIPNGSDKEIAQILQRRKQDVHDPKINGGNVQILEIMLDECKRQIITLTEDGVVKLQKCGDQAEREKASKKRQAFLKAVWGKIHAQITARMQEMGTCIDQDVRNKLNGICEMFRVDVGSQLANFRERRQGLEQGIRNVANAVGDRLLENNHRNNIQEKLLKEISDALMGLKGEMGE